MFTMQMVTVQRPYLIIPTTFSASSFHSCIQNSYKMQSSSYRVNGDNMNCNIQPRLCMNSSSPVRPLPLPVHQSRPFSTSVLQRQPFCWIWRLVCVSGEGDSGIEVYKAFACFCWTVVTLWLKVKRTHLIPDDCVHVRLFCLEEQVCEVKSCWGQKSLIHFRPPSLTLKRNHQMTRKQSFDQKPPGVEEDLDRNVIFLQCLIYKPHHHHGCYAVH